MELFEFKRYFGEVDELNSEPKRENQIDDYLSKVKERKRLREETTIEEDTGVEFNNLSEQIDEPALGKRTKKKSRQGQNNPIDALTEYLDGVRLRKRAREGTSKDQNQDKVLIEEFQNQSEFAHNLKEDLKKSPASDPVKSKRNVSAKRSDYPSTSRESAIQNISEQTTEPLDSTPPTAKPRKKKKKKKVKTTNEDNVENGVIDEVKALETSAVNKPIVKFEVLGAHSFENKTKVKRVLPRWLAEPTVISSSLSSSKGIKDVGKLHKDFIQNLQSMGINTLFPVQLVVIPYLLQCLNKSYYLWPRDLCVSAPTGSGKTLAYALPILQAHFSLPKNAFYALVVVPVQELAWQVTKVFRDVAKGTGIKIGCITGGTDRELEAKNLVLKQKDGTYFNLVHILVATPGRLIEHFFLTPGFSVKNLKFIVIDEADRVVEQKSLNWLHLVEKQCNPAFNGSIPPVTFHNLVKLQKGPQKLLFSATLSQDPEKLLKFNLFQPKLITSVSQSKVYGEDGDKDHFYGKFTTPATLKEKYVVCDIDKKPLLVHKFLIEGWRRILVFTKSCVEANRLCELLKKMNLNIKIEGLTSHMILGKRQLVIDDFSQGNIDVLVCSDRMARGMDIKDVNYVIIYDPPKYAKGYIHKAGRTGRAGKSGTAVTILTPKQLQGFLQMLGKAGKTDLELIPLDESDLDDYTKAYEEALVYLKTIVNNKKSSQLNSTIKEKRTKTIISTKKRKKAN